MALTKVTGGVLADDAVGVAGLSATGTASASTFLRGDNAWASASAGFEKYTVVTSTDATFALQSGTTKLIIEVQASGGYAGNNDGSTNTRGGTGGGGAYAKKLLSTMVDTDTLNITIGAVAAIAASGTTTSVASASGTAFTTITCVGGAGGGTGVHPTHADGGAGGTLPTTGDFNLAGGNGCTGYDIQSYVENGGGSFYSIVSDRMVLADSNGQPALGYGGGGGSGNGAARTGATGSPAVVIVWEYK